MERLRAHGRRRGRRNTSVACHSICMEFEDGESVGGGLVAAGRGRDAGNGRGGYSLGLDVTA